MTEEAAEKESLLCDRWPKPVSHLCHHRPHKDKSWFLNSSPPPPPPSPPPPPHTESLGITRPGGKMLDGLFVSADRGGSVSFDDHRLTDELTNALFGWVRCWSEQGPHLTAGSGLIFISMSLLFFFLLWFILDFSDFRNGINTGCMLHKYSGRRMLNPSLKLHSLCSAFSHSPKLLLWFRVMQCKRVMADRFGTKTGKDCLLSKVTGLSLLFPRSYAGLPDWFE